MIHNLERRPYILRFDQELFPQNIKLVGPILSNNFTTPAIIKALEELNPEINIKSQGAYIKALAPNRCILSRFVVEKYLGRNFIIPDDLELSMPSFFGQIHVVRDEVFWTS